MGGAPGGRAPARPSHDIDNKTMYRGGDSYHRGCGAVGVCRWFSVSEDTAPIRFDERFDESRVAEYLRTVLGDELPEGPIDFEQFPGGAANLTYLARCGDRELVLRRPPLGETAKGAHDMEREHRVLSRLWRVFPKAPRSEERRVGKECRSRWSPAP